MFLRFTAKTSPQHFIVDKAGKMAKIEKDEIIEVSKLAAEMLLKEFGEDFEICDGRPKHAPKADKLLRKTPKTKTK